MINLSFKENGERKSFGFGSFIDAGHTGRDDIVNELQICLDEIAKPYPRCDFSLILSRELITLPVLALLIQLLNQPCTRLSSTAEPRSITGDEATKWTYVEFHECRLALPDSTPLQTLEDGEYCSPDDIQKFGSTVALRTTSLQLTVHHECPDILHAVCDAPKLEISEWSICKREFSALDCAKLANFVQRSERPPASLRLTTRYIEAPPVLAEGLVKITDKVSIGGFSEHDANDPSRPNYPSLDNMLVGEGGNGMMQRLLQSLSSQLNDLCLANVQLDDRHFMAIVDMLPTSQLKSLSLLGSYISWRGIMAFADQLPLITYLTTVTIDIDRSEQDHLERHRQEYCMAMTKGMRDNYSIVKLRMTGLPDTPKFLVSHYVDLNDAGRRILATSKPVPVGLWPFILERAGTKFYGRFWWEYDSRRANSRRANAMYFVLRNFSSLVSCPLSTTRRQERGPQSPMESFTTANS